MRGSRIFPLRKTLNEEGRVPDNNNASPSETTHGDNAFRSKDTARSILGQLRGSQRRKCYPISVPHHLTLTTQWNINTLVLESAQAREDRKKRKELKKLAKANAAGASGSPSATSPTAATFAAPTPGSSTGATSTPKLNRPPPVQIPLNQDIARGGTPRATPTSAGSQQQHLIPNTGIPTEKRGKKRDHDEATRQQPQQQGPAVQNQNQNGVLPKTGVMKAGVRPRPMKKQRMVSDPGQCGRCALY